MERNLVKPVAVVLLALQGLIAGAGNIGLHLITGCSHGHEAAPCSHDHEIACVGECCGSHEAEHPSMNVVRAGSCLDDEHNCPICQWWLTSGRHVVATTPAMSTDLQPFTGMVGDFGILLPGQAHRESSARGPPSALPIA